MKRTRYKYNQGKFSSIMENYENGRPSLDEIPCFRHIVRVRQPVDADCVISKECYSQLFYHMSKKWERPGKGKI